MHSAMNSIRSGYRLFGQINHKLERLHENLENKQALVFPASEKCEKGFHTNRIGKTYAIRSVVRIACEIRCTTCRYRFRRRKLRFSETVSQPMAYPIYLGKIVVYCSVNNDVNSIGNRSFVHQNQANIQSHPKPILNTRRLYAKYTAIEKKSNKRMPNEI